MKKVLISLFLVLYLHHAQAQSMLPSTDALSNMRHSTSQGLYSGQPNISVPLFTLPGRKLTLPIYLDYNARGIKIDEIAGPFGMGWSLQAGGMISRQVRGLADEVAEGMCSNDQADIDSASQTEIVNEAVDSEPDLFFYSFPGGSGQFFIVDGTAHTVPHRDIVIDLSDFCNGLDKITITNESGFKYIFSEPESTQTTKNLEGDPSTILESFDEETGWYLTEIIGSDELQEFAFTYTDDEAELENSRLETFAYYGLDGDCAGIPEKVKNFQLEASIANKLLTSITSPLGRIDFNYPGGREDRTSELGAKIGAIELTNLDGTKITAYSFEMSYQGSCGADKPECKRLFLDQINQFNPNTGGSDRITYRQFEYHDASDLPERYSRKRDHWGYATNINIPGLASIPETRIGNNIYGDLQLNPKNNIEFAQKGLLKSVTLPTGGNIEYIYEKTTGRTFVQDSEQFESWYGYYSSDIGPGVRIGKVRVSAGDQYSDNTQETTYAYEGGVFRKPFYAWKTSGPIDEEDGTSILSCSGEVLVINSADQNALYQVGGPEIGYDKVTEIRSDGATITRYFSNNEHEDIKPEIRKTVLSEELLDSYGPPFPPFTQQYWKRGLLLSSEMHDAQGRLVSRTENQYDFAISPDKAFSARKVESPHPGTLLEGKYDLISQRTNLTTSNSLLMDEDELGNYLWDSTYYSYEPNHNYLRIKEKVDSDGSRYATRYKYSFDYSLAQVGQGDVQAAALGQMKLKNIHSVPIEVVNYKNGMVANAMLRTFREMSNDAVYPFRTYIYENDQLIEIGDETDQFSQKDVGAGNTIQIDDRYRLVSEVLSYDTFGNPTLERSKTNLLVARLYEHNGTLVTQQRVYPGESSLNCLGGTLINDPGTCIVNEGAVERTSLFTYIPLVGITEEVDVNGRSTHYEYDVFNRLKLIRDHELNIMQKYEYKLIHGSEL